MQRGQDKRSHVYLGIPSPFKFEVRKEYARKAHEESGSQVISLVDYWSFQHKSQAVSWLGHQVAFSSANTGERFSYNPIQDRVLTEFPILRIVQRQLKNLRGTCE